MTIEQLKQILSEKISGQGNQVDIGGGLETILNELIEKVGGLESESPYLDIADSALHKKYAPTDSLVSTLQKAVLLKRQNGDVFWRLYTQDPDILSGAIDECGDLFNDSSNVDSITGIWAFRPAQYDDSTLANGEFIATILGNQDESDNTALVYFQITT